MTWTDFIDWLGKVGGIVAILVTLSVFMFKEKWKQILNRSLSEHLRQMEHDFQKDLEGYKVSLIAQAEAAKAQSELRKSIAMRYSEIEFERLVALEKCTSSTPSTVLAVAVMTPQQKDEGTVQSSLEHVMSLDKAIDEAIMFVTSQQHLRLTEIRSALSTIALHHCCIGQPAHEALDERQAIMTNVSAINDQLRSRIRQLGQL